MENPREARERIERETLSARACLAENTKGRERHEPEDHLRTCFGRDRDRIVHSKSFRRLGHKTQVFLAPEGDHYRVRLTHTLEVTQVARAIARALSLNEDLVEAIALGHDLGHTPFGHLGEQVVAAFFPGFRHNVQSLRIVDTLESLNLTFEVRDGIVNHTWSMPMPTTLEGQVARYADRIAYINHDIDDAIRARILDPTDLPHQTVAVLGLTPGDRVRTMVEALVSHSQTGDIAMEPEVFNAMAITREFLFERVYLGRVAPATKDIVERIVSTLLEHYATNPPEDLGDFGALTEGALTEGAATAGDPVIRAVDYVAGMTDRFALRAFERLVGEPSPGLDV